MTERKDLMNTTLADGVSYVPFRDTPICDRCATFFAIGQSWYLPAELTDPICGSCLEDLHYDQEEYIREMEHYAWMEEQGHLDADMREPSEPMYSLPF